MFRSLYALLLYYLRLAEACGDSLRGAGGAREVSRGAQCEEGEQKGRFYVTKAETLVTSRRRLQRAASKSQRLPRPCCVEVARRPLASLACVCACVCGAHSTGPSAASLDRRRLCVQEGRPSLSRRLAGFDAPSCESLVEPRRPVATT
ncbi:hypothetical protein HPB50_015925 [Hyalomma asiaticum]|uniref:Uncharacterized protein n=1 Tax=Hyalomma asiaticum TaxID=266040 RepID=A0ACB7RV20_HYAAI|nr:hypothetical protein HPB50_015925 [Hyalomma asiaticum]